MELQEQTTENLAETLAREMKSPIEIGSDLAINRKRVALPPNWKLETYDDDDRLLQRPRKKIASVSFADADSLVAYLGVHGQPPTSIWCTADYRAGKVAFLAIINDHGGDADGQDFRDHRASFRPEFSEEWNRWMAQNRQHFSQAAFAAFIEENLKDFAAVDGAPSGSQMLEMAIAFEANQDMRFKSAIRLQNGGVQMQYVQDDDAQTLARMTAFDRFSIGIPAFWNGDPYRIDARLRYRVRDGKLVFWFELIRPDKVLEAATATLIAQIKEKTGTRFYFGNPFSA